MTFNDLPSRRAFLAASATGSAWIWVPRPVNGYSMADVTPALPPVRRGSRAASDLRAPSDPSALSSQGADSTSVRNGISKWDLDTPALCVDLDKMDANIAKAQAVLTKNGVAARPHAKTHKCAAIAKRQLAAGAVGICTAKLGEAEALFAAGIDKICMTTANPSVNKIKRAVALAKRNPQFIQAVDFGPNARDLSAAAKAAGITADVVIDIAVGTRSGVPPGDEAVALAKLVDALPNVRLRGLLSYDGGAQHIVGFAARKERALKGLEANVKVYEALEAAGLNTEIFSGGGTGTYSVQHLTPGFTDVQVGSYVFMDMQYLAIGSEDGDPVYKDFEVSLTVIATVVNNRFPGRLTTDAGAKALTINVPRAGVIGEPDFDYNAGSDEFGVITFKDAAKDYGIGDRLEMIVPHCDPVVNLYDHIYGIRNDRVEAVWQIEARGKSQ